MKYTVRFAHLADIPPVRLGEIVKRGQLLGEMGSTGQSTAAHVHLDVVEGEHPGRYTLADIEAGKPPAAPPRQALYFCDAELFGVKPVFTTGYADPEYFFERKKVHLGFDVVPYDRNLSKAHWGLHWPRSMDGRVVAVAWDPKGYGHCLQIVYEA